MKTKRGGPKKGGGRKSIAPQDKESTIASRFNEIKALMEKGYTRQNACKKIGIGRSWFYKNITKEQNRILDQIYFSFSQGSNRTKWQIENNK